jgi:hypothetical protein
MSSLPVGSKLSPLNGRRDLGESFLSRRKVLVKH